MTLPNDDLSVFKTANSGYAGVLTKKTEGYSIHLWECKKTLMLMNCCQNIFPTYIQVNLCQKLFYLKIMGRTFFVYKNVRNNFCTQHVLPRFELGIFMYWTCNLMNNLSSYCGLVDAKIIASDKDLPVIETKSLRTRIVIL